MRRRSMQTTRRAFLGTVCASGAIAVGVRSGIRRADAQGLAPVKIGHVVLGDFGINTPTMVALVKGFFKQQGLDAEMIPFKGGPDLLKGVMALAADIGLTAVGATTWVFARMLAKKMSWDPEKDVRILGVGGLDAQAASLRRNEIQ